ncbi:MAG: hypothetical protein ACE5JF_12740 [Anaerolineales bacterium]
MNTGSVFRVIFVFVLVSAFVISGYFHRKARQSGETISRRDEGSTALVLRMIPALLFFGSMVLHIVAPDLMSWATIELPSWLQWIGAAIFRLVVIPRKESRLIEAFGAEYQAYQIRTDAMLPRLST